VVLEHVQRNAPVIKNHRNSKGGEIPSLLFRFDWNMLRLYTASGGGGKSGVWCAGIIPADAQKTHRSGIRRATLAMPGRGGTFRTERESISSRFFQFLRGRGAPPKKTNQNQTTQKKTKPRIKSKRGRATRGSDLKLLQTFEDEQNAV